MLKLKIPITANNSAFFKPNSFMEKNNMESGKVEIPAVKTMAGIPILTGLNILLAEK